MRSSGTIVRFDDVRGYGFIAPDMGGEDVFLHVNDLEFERVLARRGAQVSFEIENGDRGSFATGVQLCPEGSAQNGVGHADAAPQSDDYFDVLSAKEFKHTITEILLESTPSLTGEQIQHVRKAFDALARKHGWVE